MKSIIKATLTYGGEERESFYFKTEEAYHEWTLSLSTGDYSTHRKSKVEALPEGVEYSNPFEESVSKVLQALEEAEEEWYEEDCPDYLGDYFQDDDDYLLEQFRSNYRPSFIESIIAFGEYESSEAQFIIKKLGEDKVAELLRKHSFVKACTELYHQHWNDLGYMDCSEYEIQLDFDDDSEHWELILKSIEAGDSRFHINDKKTYAWTHTYISLGAIRLKLDVETFEKDLLENYKLDALEGCEVPKHGRKLIPMSEINKRTGNE